MISLISSVLQTSGDISSFKVGIIFENLLLRNSGRKEIKHILYSDTHSPDAGTTTTLIRVKCNAINHGIEIAQQP